MHVAESIHSDLVERIAAAEGLRSERVTHMLHAQTGAPVGEMAVFSGLDVDKAVGLELEFDDGDDPAWVRMLHVFAPSRGLVPHFAMEWTGTRGDDAERVEVLVDLVPRVDLAVNLEYVDAVYGPLTMARERCYELPGVIVERVPPRRAVTMSPWRLSVSVPNSQVQDLEPMLEEYVEHWLSLRSGGVGASVDPLASDQTRLVQHDRFHRAALFDPASDPLWNQVDRLIGLNEAAEIRFALRTQNER